VRGSLTDGDEILLVNASNTNAALGSGVSGAIRRACGAGYQEHIVKELERRFGGPMEPGDVLVTDAGAHPRARWVAHVAVMDYREGFTGRSFPTLALIERASANLWRAVEAVPEPVTVAMVALGAGTGQLGVREPTRIACETLAAHLAATPQTKIARVTFYGWELYEHMAIADVVRAAFPQAEVAHG
jgi:O-acetyl-ADP-ribose deacetylase (regulator of RNase III)